MFVVKLVEIDHIVFSPALHADGQRFCKTEKLRSGDLKTDSFHKHFKFVKQSVNDLFYNRFAYLYTKEYV